MRALALLLAATAAVLAGQDAEEPKNQDFIILNPDDGRIDKPGKPGVAPPRPIPTARLAAEKKPQEPKHINPFKRRGRKPSYAVPARITYSDGKVLEGWVWRRANAPIRIFNRKGRAHEDYLLAELKRIDVVPESQNFERDWRWKNQGSSEKVFLETGYLWNQYLTTFTLSDGSKVSGDCSGQFYIMLTDGTKTKWYLYKRQSGRDKPHDRRDKLQPLVHVRSVEFTDDFLKKPKAANTPGDDS